MNGYYRFGFYWNCGCVMSDRAIKEIPSDKCQNCGKECDQDDFIYINENEEENTMKNMKKNKQEIVGKRLIVEKVVKEAKLQVEIETEKTNSLYNSLFTSSEQYQRNMKEGNKTDRGTYSYF